MDASGELPNKYSDQRGVIQTIRHHHEGSVVVISSVPHVERANHYHKRDYHLCYVISGSIHYYERAVGSEDVPTYKEYGPGEMIHTGPMVEHTMYFDKCTVFVTLGGRTREQNDYEADLVRIKSLRDKYLSGTCSS